MGIESVDHETQAILGTDRATVYTSLLLYSQSFPMKVSGEILNNQNLFNFSI
jgi:hypothetical protein